MKAWVFTLLTIIGLHVLVLDTLHHGHDQGVSVTQSEAAGELAQADVLDQGSDHCCQCHGFLAIAATPASQLPAPVAPQVAARPPMPDSPADNPYRPPILIALS
ncbi:hypothetical protein A11A3_09345 [Alcanivorax hongdengensis A-11-3]|uniref:DUF2946 domain-containing protein n=1 Tax=Alcanivorax hongdengensis A-11-3 TaxID=1177179 RepID=L0WBP3_9GAMM|nr:hypothetical protein [Alcanivorax hongdengensis]EKF74394.1 hypothetical protein A11A3_09345 [Alcanivorax hongdengensis A-11-3]